jgi:hypothetical protein
MATQPSANRQKDFIAEIKTKGIARTNRFTVDFTPPKAMPELTKRMLLFCEKASLPGINFATAANRSYGETREVIYDRMYDPITLTFHVDRQMTVKTIFDQWSQHIINPIDRTVGWYNDYVTPMTIRIQDLEDKSTYLVQLYEAYPKSIGAVSLDSQNNSDTMRLDVTFQYKYWYAVPIEQDPYTKLEKTAGGFKGYFDNCSGFPETFGQGLGEAGNFITGAGGQYAMRVLSQVTSRIPSIRF